MEEKLHFMNHCHVRTKLYLLKAKNQSSRSLRRTHALLLVSGFLQSPSVCARLILRYSDLGDIRSSRSIFLENPCPCSFLWNAMVRASAAGGDLEGTLNLYLSMRRAGVPANNYTYPFVLKACSSSAVAPSFGKSVHGDVIKTGFIFNSHAQAALVSGYGKWGELESARKMFDEMPERDLVAWTAMITASEQASEVELSLSLLRKMQDDYVVDAVTAISAAAAIAQLGDSRAAKSLHGHAIRHGFLCGDIAVLNAIVGMHAKCGELGLARRLFDGMPERDEISWNSMLSGYVQNGSGKEAISFFAEMLAGGPEPNFVSFLSAASACSQLGSRLLAKHLHRLIIFSGELESRAELQNAIMDMYAKCGDLDSASDIFCRRLRRDVNCFNVMISAYGMHGRGSEALELFQKMTRDEGIFPDHITFTIVLSSCSHAGLVDEGKKIFMEMKDKYGMIPMVKHYAGLVDLLGRAGRLEEAIEVIADMAPPPTDAVWGALLGGCGIYGNDEMVELATEEVLGLDPEHGGYYVLASNVFSTSRKWWEARQMREVMRSKGVRKVVACSMVH